MFLMSFFWRWRYPWCVVNGLGLPFTVWPCHRFCRDAKSMTQPYMRFGDGIVTVLMTKESGP